MGWTIRHDGTDFDIVTGDDTRSSRLLVDGVEVDAQTADYWESSTLTDGELTFEVRWGPRNTITACSLLVTRDEDEPVTTPLTPPEGTKAAKREALQRDHPTQYVVRRTAGAALEIGIGILGVGALLSAFFGALVPRINLPSVADRLPDVSLPGWLHYLDVAYWLRRLGLSWPDVAVPEWIQTVFEQKKYWLPVVIAIAIALGELERRKKIDAERAERERPDDPTD